MKNERRNKKFEDLIRSSELACVANVSNYKAFHSMQKFIKDFNLFIKQFYHIVLGVEKI